MKIIFVCKTKLKIVDFCKTSDSAPVSEIDRMKTPKT